MLPRHGTRVELGTDDDVRELDLAIRRRREQQQQQQQQANRNNGNQQQQNKNNSSDGPVAPAFRN